MAGAVGRSTSTIIVSLRIRQRRIMLGLTQQQMAELIGVTYQQAHKYETGINRISAGRLYQISQALGVEISYFFEDVDPERRNKPKAAEMMPQQRMLLELARNFAEHRQPQAPGRSVQPGACARQRRALGRRQRLTDGTSCGRAERRGLADDPQRFRPKPQRRQFVDARTTSTAAASSAATGSPVGASAVKSTSV